MARFNGFDYDKQEAVSRTRTEWREWIEEQLKLDCFVRGDHGETFIHRNIGGANIVAEIYATPSQLGVKPG